MASSRGSSSAESGVVKPMSTRAYQAKQSPSSSTGTKPHSLSQVTTKTADKDESGDNDRDEDEMRQHILPDYKCSSLHKCMWNLHNKPESELLIQIQGLIQDRDSINSKDTLDRTPIMLACEFGLTSVINLLLDHGADVNLVDESKNTVLHYIVKNKYDIIPCIERIINTGKYINIENYSNETPLMMACEFGLTSVINLLLDHRADVNQVDFSGNTVLHYIVQNKYEDIIPCIERINNTGININIQNYRGKTPLILACKFGLASVINLFVHHGADVSMVDEDGYTVLHYIVKRGNDDIIPCIERIINTDDIDINIKNQRGRTTVYNAVKYDNYNIVKLLIDSGCDVNIPDFNGRAPLCLAIGEYLEGKYVNMNITCILLDAGCDVTFSTTPGLIVLLQIAKRKNKALFHLLIQHRADVLTQHEHNKLQLVDFILRQDDLDLIEWSIQSGMYVNTVTDTGDDIFHLFAKVYFEYYNYNWLLHSGLEVNHVNNLGNTPLMVAALLNNKTFIEFLTEQQCNVNIQNSKGHTALRICIIGFTLIKETLNRKKINSVVTELCSFNYYPVYLQCVDVLLAAGADVNIQDNDWKTVLMLAASKNDRQLIQKLVNAGADVNMLDNSGSSALQYLDFYEHGCDLQCFKLLLTNGGRHLLNLPGHDRTTIIQNMMLFPCLMPVEQTCSIIRLLVANNVSLNKLALAYDDNYYNQISLHELNSDSRNVLGQLLYMSGAPRNEIMLVLNFETEDNYASVPGKLKGEFNLSCNNLSLQSLSRRIIR